MYTVPVDVSCSEARLSLNVEVTFTRPVNSTEGPLRIRNMVDANSLWPVRIHSPCPVPASSTLVGPVGTVIALEKITRPSLMKLNSCGGTPVSALLIQVPARLVCSDSLPPESAYRNVDVSTIAARASIDRTLILVRRGGPVDWFNILVIRFVLSLFVYSFGLWSAFAPE